MARLRYRVNRIIKIQRKKEEDFERAAEERIQDAIDEKMGQDAFKLIDGADSSDEIEENGGDSERMQVIK